MKKAFIAVAAFAVIAFASCGNEQKKNAENAVDSAETTVVDETVKAGAVAAIEELKGRLEEKDASKVKEALTKAQAEVQELVKNDPEKAEAYLKQLQDYLKNNAEQIKAVAGEKAAGLASTLSNVPATLVIETLKSQAGDAKATGADAVVKAAEAAAAIKNAPEATKNAVDQAIENAKSAAENKAKERAEENKKKTEEAVNAQKKKVNDAINKGLKDLQTKIELPR